MKLDLLVLAVHPDDAELGCSGTLLKYIAQGKKAGIIDLTRGELGTRGTAETRDKEAADAAAILGLSMRGNLAMRDGFFRNDEAHQLQVIHAIRKHQPEIVFTNAPADRHPDHGRASDLVNDAAFLAGLRKIVTHDAEEVQEPWRPKLVLEFIQDQYHQPDIILDVTAQWDNKLKSILAYKTQFFNPDYDEPDATYISSPAFLRIVEGRAREFGKSIGAEYGEGFVSRKLLGVTDLFSLL
ncbi:bacillithiol biosynthesis deacetylase BshB1 [Hufsiella ginkgonis]|uniref:Bacillithiol biosynthesis deacetylase BshB1 n=1 Tax=Hufsiella ginkgonis TaxID=2695274 RepID=A0A7K1XYL2_9SPHI|nr:bacillithiol biosynthesis deacetylase BshB1 [Hufsiella ginkgonis]MXV15829.1 bacillithiol biosynthesis deacetylase BshB1 [Hufsiella ginkgonis]